MNIDGIRKIKSDHRVQVRIKTRAASPHRIERRSIDGVRVFDVKAKRIKKKALEFITPLFAPRAPHRLIQHGAVQKRIMMRRLRKAVRRARMITQQPVMMRRAFGLAFAAIALVSFSGGAYLEWSSKSTNASSESNEQVLGSTTFVGPVESITPEQAMQTFIQLLNDEQTVVTGEDEYIAKKEKLKIYLTSKKSPLAKDDQALDALLHTKNMKMILAISFVESNFAKHCVDNNCSGIGVEPGHPHWREYKGLANWVLDFDKLLERRYKGWTPEEMRGVYVYPGSDNWENGVKQVLGELKKAGIE